MLDAMIAVVILAILAMLTFLVVHTGAMLFSGTLVAVIAALFLLAAVVLLSE